MATSRLWLLYPFGKNDPQFRYTIITPEPVAQENVIAAWAYALRHTAKGLDLPDHEAALKMMLDRHPSWKAVEGQAVAVQPNLALADQDEPETS